MLIGAELHEGLLRSDAYPSEAWTKIVKLTALASLITLLVLLRTPLAATESTCLEREACSPPRISATRSVYIDHSLGSIKDEGLATDAWNTLSAVISAGLFEKKAIKTNDTVSQDPDKLESGATAPGTAIGAPASNITGGTRELQIDVGAYLSRTRGGDGNRSVPIDLAVLMESNSVESAQGSPTGYSCLPPIYSACGYPDATNTGVPSGIPLKKLKTDDSCLVVSVDNTIIDGLHVTGCIDVEANNVTIQNSRITATSHIWWAIKYGDTKPNVTGLKILHVKIDSIPGQGPAAEGGYPYGISTQGTGSLEVGYSDISGFKDGINIAHGFVHNNWIHDLSKYAGAHTQGIYVWKAPVGATLLIKHNTITDLVQDSTAAIFMKEGLGIHDVTVEDNWLAGGSFTLYGGGIDAKNIQALDNKFSTEITSKGGQFGPISYWTVKKSGNSWSGNIWANGPNAGRRIAPAY